MTDRDDPPSPGGRPPKAVAEQYLTALDAIDGPGFTHEVATQLNVSERTARRRLTDLADADVINSKKSRNIAVWWLPDDASGRLAALDTTPFDSEPVDDYNS